jgi:hypothetical protein
MRYRSGQVPTATIIVASIFALMFIGTVTFFVYQFQHAGSNKNTKNKNTNKNTNTVVTNANTNTTPTTDLSPLNPIPDAWTTYSSTLAPYTIRYPKEWTLEEVIVPNDPVQKVPVKYARLSDPTGQVVLSLGVRKVGAITGIGDRTAAPTGTTSTGTALTVGGVSITGTNLVSEGNKVVAMFYYPIKPFGFSYVQGYEVQSEINLITVPGVTAPISDLSATTLTQIANTILSSLSFTGSSSTTPPPPVTIPPLGQYKVETYKATATSSPDTRLISKEGGQRVVVIDSTRASARLDAKHGLLELVFPGFGNYIYLQDAFLQGIPVKGTIWSYNTNTNQLTKEVAFPVVGYGTLIPNTQRTKAVYVSSSDATDSGNISTLYYFDLVKKTVVTLLTLPENQSFSSGWGGNGNSFRIFWKTDSIVGYTAYGQQTGNKQKNVAKDKVADGEVTIPQ